MTKSKAGNFLSPDEAVVLLSSFARSCLGSLDLRRLGRREDVVVVGGGGEGPLKFREEKKNGMKMTLLLLWTSLEEMTWRGEEGRDDKEEIFLPPLPPRPPPSSRPPKVLVEETQVQVQKTLREDQDPVRIVRDTEAMLPGEDEDSDEAKLPGSAVERAGKRAKEKRSKGDGFSNSFADDGEDRCTEGGSKVRAEDGRSKYALACLVSADGKGGGGEEGDGEGVFGNGRSPAAASSAKQDDPEESPSLLGSRGAAARRKPKAAGMQKLPEAKVTNRFGLEVRKTSPRQLERNRRLKQSNIRETLAKIGCVGGAGKPEAKQIKEEDDDMKRAKELSLETAREEEGKRRRRKRANRSPSMTKAAPPAPPPLDDSFDRLPEREQPDLGYKYAHAPVRNKLRRRHELRGHDCHECARFYADASAGERRALMAACSRHRARHSPPPASPQDFLKLDITAEPSTARESSDED